MRERKKERGVREKEDDGKGVVERLMREKEEGKRKKRKRKEVRS